MSILAEPRRKNRLSIDPQNLQWKNDDQKKSRKLMEKMGWSDGDGLGKNRQGNADHVKLKANYSGKGLGADKLASYDTTWIGHHDDFADLLSALNKNKEEPAKDEQELAEKNKKLSLELNSKSLKRRIHYQKFTRAKDTSNYTANDRSAVLGIGLKRTKEEEEVKKEEEEREKKSSSDEDVKESVEPAGNTTVSTMSVGDYFAAKMAALAAKRQQVAVIKPEDSEKPDAAEVKKEEAETDAEKAERKRLKRERKAARRLARQQAEEGDADTVKQEESAEMGEEQTVKQEEPADEMKQEPVDDYEKEKEEREQRKKEKKRRREMERQMKQEQGEEGNSDEPATKKMKTEIKEEMKEEVQDEEEQLVSEKKKKKKSKKRDLEE